MTACADRAEAGPADWAHGTGLAQNEGQIGRLRRAEFSRVAARTLRRATDATRMWRS
ncbi:hypothetical protein [Streptomyces griseochromogenes]|uniref:hypothetical protein n=1 Tax=Streptomyces griseochromogenes TaxID=68214 RepID=UPI0037A6E435